MTNLKQKIVAATLAESGAIEKALVDNLQPNLALIRQVGGHLLFAGGKRLRPLLMVLAARLCGHTGADAIRYSVIFEYLHTATLLHDDVVDGADLRRGQPVANKVWDAPTAVLTGDYLLARALSLATATGNPAVVEVIAAITEEMAQGELRQLVFKGNLALTEEAYFEVIRGKTAVLFEAACKVGALVAGAVAPLVEALGNYGFALGMAFQIADDMLDYTQETAVLGKRVGADLREGKLTLPVIHALRQSDAETRRWMNALIERRSFSQGEFDRLISILNACGSLDYSRECALAHVARAKQALLSFGATVTRDLLWDVADYAVARVA
jgi:octaprenyl-diphosphate synthase